MNKVKFFLIFFLLNRFDLNCHVIINQRVKYTSDWQVITEKKMVLK